MADFLESVCRVGVGWYWLFFASQKWGGVAWVHPVMVSAGLKNPVPGVHEFLVQVVTPGGNKRRSHASLTQRRNSRVGSDLIAALRPALSAMRPP